MNHVRSALLVLALTLAPLAACGDKNAPLSNPDTGTTSVSYLADIEPLLVKSCSCHATGASLVPPPLDTYANVKSASNQADNDIQNDVMPKSGPLSSADKALFHSWVAAGAPQN